MRALLLSALTIALYACDDHRPDIQAATPPGAQGSLDAACKSSSSIILIDTASSVIRWKGTKFRGRGKHEGIIRLLGGGIEMCDGNPVGGTFTIDMRSIDITDIPAHETVPRRRLRNHLIGEDFFAVDRFPTATFQMTEVRRAEKDSFRIAGDLSMRGQRHGIAFKAVAGRSNQRVRASAQFSINRHLWGVAYRGSSLTNDLVDDNIYLDVELVAGG